MLVISGTFVIALVIFIIVTSLVLFEFYRTRDFCNPFIWFMGLWGIMVILAGMALFGMKKVDVSTYLYVFVGLFFFAISWFFYELIPSINIKKTKIIRYDDIKNSVLLSVLIVCLLYYLYYSWCTGQRLLAGYSYVDIRNIHQGYVEEKAFDNASLLLLNYVFCSPALESVFTIASVNYIKNGEGRQIFILSIICFLFYFFATASRFSLVFIILTLTILSFRYRDRINKTTKRKLRYLAVFLSIAIIIMVWLRSLGTNDSILYNISETLYQYIASPIPMFNEKLKAFNMSKDYMFGKIFLYGFFDFLDSILKYLRIANWDIISDAKYYIVDTEKFVKIYDEHVFNAFVSIFYYFYIDFGVPGIALGSAIWARILHYIYDKYRKFDDIGIVAVFCEILFFIALTGVRWPFSYLHNILLIVYTLLFTSGLRIKYKIKRR